VTPVAALPMYDWPEVQAATDALWAALRDALRARRVAAPEALERGRGLMEVWTDPELVLGQACGLPLVQHLLRRVSVVGALDYGLPGCAPGEYCSAVVVRADDPRQGLAAFRGARLALNGTDSQSGYGAILHHVAPLAGDGRFFGAAVVTGAHAASAALVAAGGADIASIDHVSWNLWLRHRDDGRLRVLMLTDPTPGLPYVTALGRDPAPFRRAGAAAVARLDPASRSALGLAGFVAFAPADYARLGARVERAEALAALA
jgi:ABC-type phosphate/phosphonate transport system substrate-binding protein